MMSQLGRVGESGVIWFRCGAGWGLRQLDKKMRLQGWLGPAGQGGRRFGRRGSERVWKKIWGKSADVNMVFRGLTNSRSLKTGASPLRDGDTSLVHFSACNRRRWYMDLTVIFVTFIKFILLLHIIDRSGDLLVNGENVVANHPLENISC